METLPFWVSPRRLKWWLSGREMSVLRTSLFAAALLSLALTISAAQPPKRVLVLHSFGPAFGDYSAKALRDELDRQLPGRVDLYESWLISARFTSSEEDPAYASYLESLFAERPIDLIVTFGGPAANFVQKHRQSLFPSVPALFADVEERRAASAGFTTNDAAVTLSVSIPAIAANILQVLPRTSNLAVVLGNSPIERYWAGEIRRSLALFASRLNLIFLDELSFDDLLQRVATLPPRSAILYAMLSPEVAGIPADEDRAFAKLHAAANAPMFSYTDAYLGKGIVGGPLLSSEEEGRKAANLAVRILQGERPADLGIASIPLGKPQFDARELRRWEIKAADLPAGSVIRFREPSAWERYRWQIASVGLLLLLETALILGLLDERRRRRNAEIEAHQRIAELAHVNRRATVGELSGAIAHELNQPLGAILRNTEAAELMLGAASPDVTELKEILSDIKHDDERAGEVIRRLRRLLGKAPLEPHEIDLNEILSEVFAFLSAQASARRVTLNTSLTSQAPRISGDRIQLQQVILNLVMNGMDAIGSAGSRDRHIVGRTRVVGGILAEVSIEDSGPGIPIDKAKKIFEPFFTTKAAGMGMGLSIARTIIESHRGEIWAHNQSEGGAVFRFTLPLVRGGTHGISETDTAGRAPAAAPQVGEARGEQSILRGLPQPPALECVGAPDLSALT
jgi:signal transduction histidine kinase